MLKFQAVAEKTAKNFRGLLFLPHPVQACRCNHYGCRSFIHANCRSHDFVSLSTPRMSWIT